MEEMVRVLLFLLITNLFCFTASAYTITGRLSENLKKTILQYHEDLGQEGIISLLEANDIKLYHISEDFLFVGEGLKVQSIVFNGNYSFLKSQLLSIIGIYEDELYNSEELTDAQLSIMRFYRSYGFRNVQVSYLVNNGHIVFDIDQGYRSIITEVRVIGVDESLAPKLSKNLLLNKENISSLSKELNYKLRKKGFFNNNIKVDVMKVDHRAIYFDSDYPLLSIFSFLPSYNDAVALIFDIKKGTKYTVNISDKTDLDVRSMIQRVVAKNLINIDIFNIRNLENAIAIEISKLYYSESSVRVNVHERDIFVDIKTGNKKFLKKVYVKYQKLKDDKFIDKSQKLLEGEEDKFLTHLKQLLKDEGYYNADVTSIENKNKSITYHIDEGNIYKIGTSYIGEIEYTSLQELIASKEGLEKNKIALGEKLAKEYYFEFLNIEKIVKTHDGYVDIYYKDNIRKIRYEDIVVNNSRIQKIIKRNYFSKNNSVTAQNILQTKRFLSSQQAIASHKISLIPVTKDSVIIVINLVYKEMNEFFGGVSYDSINSLIFHLGYKRHNIFNTARELEFVAAESFRETFGSIKLSSFGTISDNLHDSIELMMRDRDEDDYRFREQRLTLSLGSGFDSLLLSGTAYLEEINIYDEKYTDDISSKIEDQFLNFGVSASITYFNLDNIVNPENGVALKFHINPVLSNEYRGFIVNSLNGSIYYTFLGKFITSLKGEMGAITGEDESIPLTYRLTLGGPYRMKAFDYREIGLKDSDGHVYGGKTLYYGELSENYIINDFIMVGVFYEVGQASDNFKEDLFDHDIGSLLSIITPLGSLKLSVAMDLNKHSRRAFYITFGTQIP